MRRVVIVMAALALISCRIKPGENGERGGEPERQLAQATVAMDVARVRQLLGSGANPNKMAPHEGHDQSPWKLALHQVRPNRPDTITIVRLMLDAGAKPEVAWGEGPSVRGGYSVQSVVPLSEVLTNQSPDVARALLRAGLDPASATLELEEAVENGQEEMVHILVEAGVNVNSRPTAITPLVAAIQTRNVALMTYLEEHGARENP
jgi:hypothetical protein